MKKKRYKGNKLNLFKVRVLPVLVLLAAFTLMFSISAFSSDVKDRYINFNGDEWNLGDAQKPTPTWFTKEKDITFTVNLEEDYRAYLKDNLYEMDESGPFEITGKYGKSQRTIPMDVNPIMDAEDSFNGQYEVTAELYDYDAKAIFTIEFQGKKWGIQPYEKSFQVIKDTKAPEVTLKATSNKSEANGKRVNGAVNVEINAKDKTLENVKIEATRNGEDISNQFPWKNKQIDHKLEQNGEYSIKVIASDEVGHKSEESIAFAIAKGGSSLKVNANRGGEVEQDISIDSLVQGGIVGFEVNHPLPITNATVTVEGPDTNIEETVEGNGTSLTWGKNLTNEGKYKVSITVTDHYGSMKVGPHPFIFTIDNTAPVINIEGAEDTSNEVKVSIDEKHYFKENTNVKITRKGIDGTETIVDKSPGDNQELKQPLKKDGVYTIEVTAKDKAGNVSTETRSFTVDKTAPQLTLSEEINNKYFNEPKALTFTLKDLTLDLNPDKTYLKLLTPTAEESTTLAFKQKENNDYIAELKREFTEEGVYEITIIAVDQYGNKLEKTQTFTIDKTAPKLSIKAGDAEIPAGKFFTDPIEINISVEDVNYDKSKTKLKVKHSKDELEEAQPNDETYQDLALDDEGNLTFTFAKNGNYKITLESTDKAGNKADDLTVTFTIDKDAPILEIGGVKDGNHYQKANVTFTASDFTLDFENTVLKYQRDDEEAVEIPLKQAKPWKATAKALFGKEACERDNSEEKVFVCEEGNYTLTLNAKDKAGNGELKKTIKFILDYTAPNVTFSGIEDGSYIKNGELTIGIDEKNYETNAVTVMVEKDGTEVEKEFTSDGETSTLTLPFQTDSNSPDGNLDGEYTVTVTATDEAGNSTGERKMSFTIDNDKPEILINGVDHNTYYDKDKNVAIIITEENFNKDLVDIKATKKGTAKNIHFGEGKDWEKNKAGQWVLKQHFADDGEYSITVNASDDAENNAEEQAVTFTIDNIDPQLSIKGVKNNNNYKSQQATIIVSDTNIDLKNTILTITKGGQRYDAGELKMVEGTTTARLTHNFTEEGVYRIKLETTDKSGRTAKHEDVVFIIDSTAPVIDILGVKNGSFNPKDMLVTVAVTELNYVSNKVDIQVTRNGENDTDYPADKWNSNSRESKLLHNFKEDGHYTVSITAMDKAGNGPVTKNLTFTVDKTKPAIDISGVNSGEHYNVNKVVTIGIADTNLDINKATVTRNGSSYNAGAFSTSGNKATLVHTFTAEGEYDIFVEATDKAGNNFTKEMNFTIDKTAPVITPYVGGENHIIKDGEFINRMFTPNFSLDVKEDRIISVLLNGKDVTGKIPAITVDGDYDFKVLARDKAGNESEIAFGFTLDVTMPKLDISGVVDGYFNKDIVPLVTYSDKNLDKEKTSLTLNGQPYKSGTKLEYEQDYVLKANIVDLAGNVTARSIVFTIDKTAPAIKFLEPISEQYFNSSIIPELIVEDMSSYDIISMTLNGEPYEIGQKIKDEGKHVLYFEVKDAAGNIKQLSVEFIVDMTPPKVIYEGVKKNEVYYDPVYVRISLDNPFDRIQTVTVNGELFEGEVTEKDGRKFVKVSATQLGDYEIKVLAVDEAGNESVLTIPFSIAEKSLLMKVYENKPLFAGSVAGGVALLSAAGTLGYRRIRNKTLKKEIENDYFN